MYNSVQCTQCNMAMGFLTMAVRLYQRQSLVCKLQYSQLKTQKNSIQRVLFSLENNIIFLPL